MTNRSSPPVPLQDQLCFAVYSAGIAIQRLYKPMLDRLGLTSPQYLVLNVLWHADNQTVGGIAGELALESSTLTPLLKRLEVAGLVRRARNPANERQVVISLTERGRAIRNEAGCLGEKLLTASGETAAELGELNRRVAQLRDAVYRHVEDRGAETETAE